MSLLEKYQKINKKELELSVLKNEFSNDINIYNKLKTIAEYKCQGHTEPTHCGDEYNIWFALKNNSIEEIKRLKYPISEINVDFDAPDILRVDISALFRGEIDTGITITFPLDENEFNLYIEQLKENTEIFVAEKKDKELKEKHKKLQFLKDQYEELSKEIEDIN